MRVACKEAKVLERREESARLRKPAAPPKISKELALFLWFGWWTLFGNLAALWPKHFRASTLCDACSPLRPAPGVPLVLPISTASSSPTSCSFFHLNHRRTSRSFAATYTTQLSCFPRRSQTPSSGFKDGEHLHSSGSAAASSSIC